MARKKVVSVRLKDEEWRALNRAADEAGRNVSDWLKELALEAVGPFPVIANGWAEGVVTIAGRYVINPPGKEVLQVGAEESEETW